MANRGKDSQVPVDFDSPEYDAQFEEPQLQDVQDEASGRPAGLQDRVQTLLAGNANATYDLEQSQARQQVLEQAVDSCLESALVAMDMLFVAREDRAVTPVSLLNFSWEPEQPPEPCAMDTWLRAAIPETQQPKQSWALTEFMKSGAKQQHSRSRRATNTDSSTHLPSSKQQNSGSSTQEETQIANPTDLNVQEGTQTQPDETFPSNNTQAEEQAAAEQRLREELEVRRAQLRVAADMEAASQDAHAKIRKLQATLKGRAYTYDHKGNVVPTVEASTTGSPQLHVPNPSFTVRPKQDAGAHGKARKNGTSANGAANKAGTSRTKSGAGTAAADAATGERQLANEFKETARKTQPNALEVMTPSSGVTLRGGSQSKAGPVRARSAMGMSRQELEQFASATARLGAHTKSTAGPARGHRASGSQALSATAASPDPKQQGLNSRASSHAVQQADNGISPESGSATDDKHVTKGTTLKVGALTLGEGVLSQLPDSPSKLAGATLRTNAGSPAQGSGKKPQTPDANLALVGSPDWGRGGSKGSHAVHAALETIKPSARNRELEVGRFMRLPRERASQATASPPLSPAKLQQQQQQLPPRMTFAAS